MPLQDSKGFDRVINCITWSIDPEIIIFIKKYIASGDLLWSETARKLQRIEANRSETEGSPSAEMCLECMLLVVLSGILNMRFFIILKRTRNHLILLSLFSYFLYNGYLLASTGRTRITETGEPSPTQATSTENRYNERWSFGRKQARKIRRLSCWFYKCLCMPDSFNYTGWVHVVWPIRPSKPLFRYYQPMWIT